MLLVEAKRAGTYFSLPDAFIDDDRYRYVQVKTLLTDPIIAEAMLQVYTYCVGSGGEHAAITNGSQWIFFKTFVRSKDWRKEQAFVIVDASYFSLDHSHARKHFSYASITTEASLLDLFGDSQMDHRPRFFPKEKITAYNHEVTSNHLSPVMRPMIERFFGKMNASDSEFMEQCYVNHREYRVSSENVKQLISDSLSPYFRDYSVRDFFDDFGGGEFGNRISSSARDRMKWSPLFGPRG